MNRRISEIDRLETTILGLERLILDASDSEILADFNKEGNDLAGIRSLIARHLGKAPELLLPKAGAPNRVRIRNTGASRPPKESSERLAMLRNLVAIRPDLSPRLNAVFASGKAPSGMEIEKLIDELDRLGALPKGDPDIS